jgi:hypothetical protein
VRRFLPLLLVALTAIPAAAQPAPTPVPTPPPEEPGPVAPADPMPATPPDPAGDEARIRAIVAEELARRAAADPGAVVAPDLVEEAPPEGLTGASGFTDVRLNLTLTNENVLAAPGETLPSVPGWRFGRPSSLGTLFFDNYDTRFSGYETLSHAVMYRNHRAGQLEAEGALVLRINELSERRIELSDAGSYVRVSWWQDPTRADPTRLSLTAFPVSADRFRLGYSYRLSWGGNEDTRDTSPGVKVQWDTDRAYVFAGAKSAVLLNRRTGHQEASLSYLAGAGVDVTPELRVELNGGFFDRGYNELQDVQTERLQLFGASAQVAFHRGMPVQSSIDYKLYKYDPDRIGRIFQKAQYPGGLQWLAMAEATLLGQTLKHPEMTGTTRIQWGAAGDVNLRATIDRYRVRADLQYRDLAFVMHSVPSLPTFVDFPRAYRITPNYFAAAGVDRNWADRYTLGVIAGVDMPASLTSPSGIPGDLTATGETTAVIRNDGKGTLISILPYGERVLPMFASKLSGQIDFGEIYAAVLDVYYVYDPNQSRLVRDDAEDLFDYEFGEFNQLGVNLTLQAKF